MESTHLKKALVNGAFLGGSVQVYGCISEIVFEYLVVDGFGFGCHCFRVVSFDSAAYDP